MTIRTPYLVSHTKSTNLWFRRTIPVGWRQLAGRREIHFSLQTANKREAARRCRLASAVVQIIFDEAERWLERGAPEVNAFAIKLRAAIDLRVNELKQAYAPKVLKAHETNLNEGDTIDVQIARLGLSDALTHEGVEAPENEEHLPHKFVEINGVLEQVCHTDLKQESTPIEVNNWSFYIERWNELRAPSYKTYRETVSVAKEWEKFSRNKPLALVTPEDVREWIHYLKVKRKLQPPSIKRKIALVRAVLNLVIRDSLLSIPSNPFEGAVIPVSKRLEGQEKRLPFTEQHLQTLFTSPVYQKGAVLPGKGGREAAFWIPLIAFTTGARLEEIGQLYLENIIMRQGRTWIRITDDKEHQSIKNLSSRRDIPVHRELLRIGFLGYVETLRAKGEERLFPHLKMNNVGRFTNVFSTWCNEYIDEHVVDDRRYCVHSFRHNFQDFGIESELQRDVLNAITGHAQVGMGAHYGLKRGGSRVLPDKSLIRAIDKLSFGEVDLSHLYIEGWEMAENDLT